MTKRALVDDWFTNRLSGRTKLFETGRIYDASTNNAFILRLNALVAASARNDKLRPPGDLAAAILAGGKLNEHAELVVFGRWLLIDNMPGFQSKGGRKIDPHLVIKTVAVAVAELRTFSDPGEGISGTAASSARITKNDLARWWTKLYHEPAQPMQFDARLRSMRSILPAYLDHLKSGKMEHTGVSIKKSPQLEKVLAAITPSIAKTKTGVAIPTTSAIASPPTPTSEPKASLPAILSPFEIELDYSSTDRKAGYRNASNGSIAASNLRYQPKHVTSSSSTGSIRKDLEGRIVLKPEMSIRDTFEVRALIDRMVILINTRNITTKTQIKNVIDREVGAITFVHDLTIRRTDGKPDWRDQLPAPQAGKKTGQHFAIMIQDPDSENLVTILDIIDREHGIDGEIVPFLLELSIDFYPRDPRSPEEAILLREQMVGLLQRHHWASHDLLLSNDVGTPAYADARQIYGKSSKPRYLFSRNDDDRTNSDARISSDTVRGRILNAKPGNDLYLDATVYKGIRFSPFLISIQNKIADRRNHDRKTLTPLPLEECRARIEVTLTGREQLKERGFSTIDDLAELSFRKMRISLLQFKLGTLAPQQHLLNEAIRQMTTRGIYGMELKERAHHQDERKQVRLTTGKMPRNKDRESLGLVDWQEMNTVVGHALDELGRYWHDFSWAKRLKD
ncbi:hypothetical protein [Shimia thalassica]|uniref:hypothetical protein n=1 Tax=Shimia thalassica TaxID=1715693 RepID=UPI0026E2F79B|nr:hypothetical protein [Shimia thalassica]MDO6483093.1 hypothetical protein [Shimia thalassica]